MSSDRFSRFFCLTEQGWLELEGDKARPNGWVKFCELEVYQGSPYGRSSPHWKVCEVSPDRTSEEADAFERTFPRPSIERPPFSTELLKFFDK